MSAGLSALVAGTVLAVAALAFVLHPLFFGTDEKPRDELPSTEVPDDSAILALREIEFDRATGKLSDADYAELKTAYTERALTELRASELPVVRDPSLDAIEAKVREYRLTHRACPTCGVRPEPDAEYCSTCGGFLAGACPTCSAVITEPGAAFCSTCGATLARTTAPDSRAVAARF
jgi:hypothetical protein